VFDEGCENDRFRDVMDMLLVEDLLYDVGLARVREACVDIFTVRDKHIWPPTVTVYDSWRVPFAALARENGFTPAGIDEAATALTALIHPSSNGWYRSAARPVGPAAVTTRSMMSVANDKMRS
jgi:hypothetical protein